MRKLLAVLAFAVVANAHAIPPRGGWWWNEAQPGRGFTIEVQDGFLFFIGYLYNQDGSATWYVSQGPFDDDNMRFTGDLLTFSGGPCLTCAYTPAQAGPSAGVMTINFTSTTAGSLTWPGGTIPISRFYFNTPPDVSRMSGVWVHSGISPSTDIDYTDWVSYTGTRPDSTFGMIATGVNQDDRVVVAGISDNELLVLIDGSTSFWHLHRYPIPFLDTQDGLGLFFLYLKGSNPSGSGTLSMGKQLISASEIGAQAEGASTDKKTVDETIGALRALVK